MSIDPKAAARRTRGVVDDWREPDQAENTRRWLMSHALDLSSDLAAGLEPTTLVPDLLAMPKPTLRAVALTLALANAVPGIQEAARLHLNGGPGANRLGSDVFAIGRTLAAAGDVRIILAIPSSREWVLRALAAAFALSTKMGKSEEPKQRQQAAMERLNPVQLAAAARTTDRERRFADALAGLSRELANMGTPSHVTYRGL